MNKQFSTLIGITLILLGLLATAFNLIAPLLDWDIWLWETWRLWPLSVVGMGLILVLAPLLVRGQNSLGVLFIPAVPVLTTGSILFYASLFEAWGAWEWLWPLEVLAVALGFLLAALYTRTVWLAVPAIIMGANGLLFQFCAVTDAWDLWIVLWTIEPLSVGLALLLVGGVKRSSGLLLGGLVLCGLAGVGLVGMTAIFTGWWLINMSGPAVLISAGVLLLIWSAIQRSTSPNPITE